jgi:hypothetical protein
MDMLQKHYVKANAWINRHILRMGNADNIRDLLRQFSGSSQERDEEYRNYILSLFN